MQKFCDIINVYLIGGFYELLILISKLIIIINRLNEFYKYQKNVI